MRTTPQDSARTYITNWELVEWVAENEMALYSTKNVITRESEGREEVINLVFVSLDLSGSINYTDNSKDLVEMVASDHKLHQWKSYLNDSGGNLGFTSTLTKYNNNKADWDLLDKVFTDPIKDEKMPAGKTNFPWRLDSTIEMLKSAIITEIETGLLETIVGPWSKGYWTEELRTMKCLANEKKKIYTKYMKLQEYIRNSVNAYSEYKKKTRKLRIEE